MWVRPGAMEMGAVLLLFERHVAVLGITAIGHGWDRAYSHMINVFGGVHEPDLVQSCNTESAFGFRIRYAHFREFMGQAVSLWNRPNYNSS